jgi:adenylate kinase family enzyme
MARSDSSTNSLSDFWMAAAWAVLVGMVDVERVNGLGQTDMISKSMNGSTTRRNLRIHIVGTPGAGKTTLARHLATQLSAHFVELDALFWGAHWLPAEPAVFRRRVSAAVRDAHWVACGNHSSVRDLVWARADTVLWLDYSTSLGGARLIGRAVGQIKQNLRALLQHQPAPLFSHDSLLLFAFRARQERKANFETLLAQRDYAHLRVLRFRKPAETAAWLATAGLVSGEPSVAQRAELEA